MLGSVQNAKLQTQAPQGFGIICGILAVIFGGCALLTKKGGKGMAIAGLVCGIIALIPSIIVISTVGSIVDALG